MNKRYPAWCFAKAIAITLLLIPNAFGDASPTEYLKDDVRHFGSATVLTSYNSFDHSILNTSSLDKGVEISRESPDGWGFRAITLSKKTLRGILQLKYVRRNFTGDYWLISAKLTDRKPRYYSWGSSDGVDRISSCDSTAALSAVGSSTLSAVESLSYKPSIDRSCFAREFLIQKTTQSLTDANSALNKCLGQYIKIAPLAHEWNLKLLATPSQKFFQCETGSPMNSNGSQINLGIVSQSKPSDEHLSEVQIHEMLHSQSSGEFVTSEAASCCSKPQNARSVLCDDLGRLDFFNDGEHQEYEAAVDAMVRGLSEDRKHKLLVDLNKVVISIRSKYSKSDVNSMPDKILRQANASIITVCRQYTNKSVCDALVTGLDKNISAESILCRASAGRDCVLADLNLPEEKPGAVRALEPSINSSLINKNTAEDVSSGNKAEEPFHVSYRPIVGENRAAMNTFIATSASSTAALTRIATNTIAPLGNLIESTAQASETAGGGSNDFTMAVSHSDSSGTTFVTSDGTSVVTKQTFASLPNAVVNAGLDIPKETGRGVASAGANGGGGGATQTGGAPSLGGGSGGSSGGQGLGVARAVASNADMKLPQPAQIQTKKDAIKWLSTVKEPGSLLNQKWFDDKLVAFKARVSYRNQSYGDPSVNHILSVERLREMGAQP